MSKKLRNEFRKTAYEIFLFIGGNQDGSLLYQTQITTALKKPITTVNYWITNLKQEGLIDKHLNLTPKGKKLFEFLWKDEAFSKKFRAHNLQIRFKVIKCPKGFPNCFSNKIYQPLNNRRYYGVQTKFDDITVLFYSPKKIVCVLPDVFSDKEEDVGSAIALICSSLKERLEKEFNIQINAYEIASITLMHVAKIKSAIANSFILKKGNYKSKKIEIDSSKGVPEIEAVDNKTALYDISIIKEMDEIKEQAKSAPLNNIIKKELPNKQENNTKIS